ncbi:platelet glycoprotein Ib beta chain-like [Petromyzon marinus]|uniref:platelet glycoprotein Ib beta chain-like n=1 Tax=Petromyzon marinus TaxID=7757 RepID=UPI003F71F2FC
MPARRLLLHHHHHLLHLLLPPLLITSLGASPCPRPCQCEGTAVRCDGRNLSAFPHDIPRDATAVLLHDNNIARVPEGALEALPRLRAITLHGNPLLCDCGVAYLHAWLRQNLGTGAGGGEEGSRSRLNVRCAGPPALCGRRIALLSYREAWGSCERGCFWLSASQAALYVFGLAHASLALLLAGFACLGSRARADELREEAEYEDIARAVDAEYEIIGGGGGGGRAASR